MWNETIKPTSFSYYVTGKIGFQAKEIRVVHRKRTKKNPAWTNENVKCFFYFTGASYGE